MQELATYSHSPIQLRPRQSFPSIATRSIATPRWRENWGQKDGLGEGKHDGEQQLGRLLTKTENLRARDQRVIYFCALGVLSHGQTRLHWIPTLAYTVDLSPQRPSQV